MLITTTDTIPGREVVETFGMVRGSTVRAKHIGTDIVASLRNLVGGEITGYSSLLAGAREQAIDNADADRRLLRWRLAWRGERPPDDGAGDSSRPACPELPYPARAAVLLRAGGQRARGGLLCR